MRPGESRQEAVETVDQLLLLAEDPEPDWNEIRKLAGRLLELAEQQAVEQVAG